MVKIMNKFGIDSLPNLQERLCQTLKFKILDQSIFMTVFSCSAHTGLLKSVSQKKKLLMFYHWVISL